MASLRRVLLTDAGRPRLAVRLAVGVAVLAVAIAVGAVVWRTLVAVAPPGPGGAAVVAAAWVALYGLPAAAVVGLSWAVDRRTVRGLGLRTGPRRLGWGLVVGASMATTVVGVLLATGAARVSGVWIATPRDGLAIPRVGPGAGILATAVVFVAVGAGEELLVRGYLLTNLAEGLAGVGVGDRAAAWLAVLATAGLFGALHAANPGASASSTATIAVVGVLLGWTYVASGDLGLAVGIHVAWNAAVGSFYGLPVSGLATPATLLAVEPTGPATVTGGAFGPEAGLVAYAGVAVGVALSWLWLGRVERVDPTACAITVPDLRPRDS